MAQYRKKPVVIEAIEYTGENLEEIKTFVGIKKAEFGPVSKELVIPTLEDGNEVQAKHIASVGDFIIRGIQGEFYPCKPDIFEQTYEQVNN